MCEIAVRVFRPEDAEQVSKVMTASFLSFSKTSDPKRIKERFAPSYWVKTSLIKEKFSETKSFVAVEGKKIVGYIKAIAMDGGLGSLEIVGVDPASFGKGVGDLLMKAATRFWIGKKLRKISTCVSSHNTKGMIFYIRHGFVPEGFRPNHFHDGVHEIPLGKFL